MKKPTCEIHNELMYENGFENGYRTWKCKSCLKEERAKIEKLKRKGKKLCGLGVQGRSLIGLVIVLFTLFLIGNISAFCTNSSWSAKQVINITTKDPIVRNNVSVLINVTWNSNMQNNFGDLRFLDPSETLELGYWFYNNTYVDSGSVQVWIKLNNSLSSSNNQTIVMCYNNPLATTTSNISNAFLFGDDFTTNPNPNKWTNVSLTTQFAQGNGIWNISGGSAFRGFVSAINFTNITISSRFAGTKVEGTVNALMGLGNSATAFQRTTTFGMNLNNFDLEITGLANTFGTPINNTFYIGEISFQTNLSVDSSIKNDDKSVINSISGQAVAPVERYIEMEGFTSVSMFDWVYAKTYVISNPNSTFGSEQLNDAIVTQLNYPANSFNTTIKNINFNWTITPTTLNITNWTFFLWNTDSSINQTQFQLENTNQTIIRNLSLTLSNGAYIWNVQACGVGSISGNIKCSFASNRTLNISDLFINSQTFNPTTTEGNVENFTINFSLSNSNTLNSVFFYYNNTKYSPSILFDGTNYIVTQTLTIPSVTTITNNTFFWNINTASTSINTTNNSQMVSNIDIDTCAINSLKILNLTLKDEQTQNLIPSGSSGNGTIEVSVSIYPINNYPDPNFLIVNLSHTYTQTNNASVCLSLDALNSSQYYMDAQIRYSAASYVTKMYNIQKYFLTNTTALQNINLFDLLTSASTTFQITIKDSNFLNIPNALINIQRKYVGQGIYQSVEIPLSDTSGQAIGHFDLNNVLYRISVIQNNNVIMTFNDIAVVCQDPLTTQCVLNLNQPESSLGFPDFSTLGNLSYGMSFNPSTRTVTINFITSDGSVVNMFLNVSSYPNGTSLCSNSLTSSAGNFGCTIPGNFKGSIVANLFSSGNPITTGIFTIPTTSVIVRDSYLYVLALMITIPLLFIDNPIVFGFGIIIGLASAIMLNLYQQTSWLGVGSAITWLVIVVFAVMYKLSHRNREGGVY